MTATLERFGVALLLSLGACTASSSPPPTTSSSDAGPSLQEALDAKPVSSDATPPTSDPAPQPEVAAAGDASALDIPHDMPPLDAPCNTRRSFAGKELSDAIDFASAGCSVDADCVQARRRAGCRGACPTAVLATHADAYETLRSTVAERVCSTYRDDGCPYATPRCFAGTVQCVEGTCTYAR